MKLAGFGFLCWTFPFKKNSKEKCQNAEIHEFIETQMDFRLVK